MEIPRWHPPETVEFPSECFCCGKTVYVEVVVKGFSQGTQFHCKDCEVTWWHLVQPEEYFPILRRSKENLQ